MITYQDLLDVGKTDAAKIEFIDKAIKTHKTSELYTTAIIAEEYNRHRNVTITQYQKFLTKVTGEKVIDEWSANYKIPCNYFNLFVVQENQYMLGNGVTWENKETASKLGDKRRPFDTQLQKLGKRALIDGVSFGFFNNDHVDVFAVTEFVPLYDEEDGALKAGIRFWQIDTNKPLRATLYELDGFTEYIWKDGEGKVREPKRAYKQKIRTADIGGSEIYDFENYPTFPIVPFWGNQEHQSSLIGIREGIDCYDLIKSEFCNTIDEASYIYWTLQNAGAMQNDELALEDFIRKLKKFHAVAVDDEVQATPNSIQAPFESRETLLNRIKQDLYIDAKALNLDEIKSGAVVTSQITTAYDLLDKKCDEWDYCVRDFIAGILDIAGIEDNATFTRSKMINVGEEIQNLVMGAAYLTPEYVTKKILTYLGDGDQADKIISQMNAESLDTLSNAYKGKSIPEEENAAQSGAEGE